MYLSTDLTKCESQLELTANVALNSTYLNSVKFTSWSFRQVTALATQVKYGDKRWELLFFFFLTPTNEVKHKVKLVKFTCPGMTSLGTEFMPKVRGSLDCTHQPCKNNQHHVWSQRNTADRKQFDAYNHIWSTTIMYREQKARSE